MPTASSPSNPVSAIGIIISGRFPVPVVPVMADMPRSRTVSPLEWLFPGWKTARATITAFISDMDDMLIVTAGSEPGTLRVAPRVPDTWRDGWPPEWEELVDLAHRLRIATIVNGCIRDYVPADIDRKLPALDAQSVGQANALVQDYQRNLLACGNPSFRSTLSSRRGVPRFDKR